MLLLLALPAYAISRDEVIARAEAWVADGVMYSWDAWYTDPTTGSCCYRSDCSGLVSAAWGLPPPGNTTYSFAAGPWDDGSSYVISASELQPGDALNYPGDPDAGTGHIMLYVSGDFSSGWVEVYEEYTHGEPATHRWRSIDPGTYLPIRYVGIEDCSTEVCDGADNDCDGSADEAWVCELPDDPARVGWRGDAPSHTDVDGDGRSDVCARGAAGLYCALTGGAQSANTVLVTGVSNAAGFDALDNYSSLRFADINADGHADLCARSDSHGVQCWPGNAAGFGSVIQGPALTDASGWSDPANYTTLRMGDIDGDGRADVCGRGDAGFYCWAAMGAGFGDAIAGPDWSDTLGWAEPRYYSTIRMGDLDGDGLDDVCARSHAGVECFLSDGAGFPTYVMGPRLADSAGWSVQTYYDSIALADINGDGRADVCGRGVAGLYCWPSLGTSFGDPVTGPALSDGAGWSDYGYHSTIRWGDVTGDGMDDVCARGSAGAYCWASRGTSFGDAMAGPDWSDASGWYNDAYLSTFSLGDVNGDGKLDLCARSSSGVACARSTGTGFDSATYVNSWSDTQGWSAEQYFATVRVGGIPREPAVAGGDTASPDGADTADTACPDCGPRHGKGPGNALEVGDGGGCGCATGGSGLAALGWVIAALLVLRRAP